MSDGYVYHKIYLKSRAMTLQIKLDILQHFPDYNNCTSQSPFCSKMSMQNVFNVVHDYKATHHFWDGELGTSYFSCVSMVCMNVLVGITELYWLLILTYICIGAVPCEYMNWDTSHLLGVCFVSSCRVAFRVLHVCLHFECKMNEFFSCDSKMYE